MTIEILTDFDWDEVSKTELSFESTNNEYRRQVQTDLAGPSSKTTFRKVFEFGDLRLLKALFNREVDCIDCELIPVTVTSCKFEPFDQDDSVTGKTTAIVKSRDLNLL